MPTRMSLMGLSFQYAVATPSPTSTSSYRLNSGGVKRAGGQGKLWNGCHGIYYSLNAPIWRKQQQGKRDGKSS
ncbi:hypothetical protein D5086_006230 [Populus alba]|uniref:Uncharacterized protein n=1 Tax=Populus alba TaxID=43335 RepID=A0ACC4CL19_POPAL